MVQLDGTRRRLRRCRPAGERYLVTGTDASGGNVAVGQDPRTGSGALAAQTADDVEFDRFHLSFAD